MDVRSLFEMAMSDDDMKAYIEIDGELFNVAKMTKRALKGGGEALVLEPSAPSVDVEFYRGKHG